MDHQKENLILRALYLEISENLVHFHHLVVVLNLVHPFFKIIYMLFNLIKLFVKKNIIFMFMKRYGRGQRPLPAGV